MPKIFRIKNSNIAEIQNGNKLVAKSAGQTSMSVYKDTVSDSTYLGQSQINVVSQQESVDTSGISVSPKTVKLTYCYDFEKKLKATITPPSASSNIITWATSDKDIATVSKTGVVRVAKKKPGTVTITATANGYSDKCIVTVEANGYFIKSASPNPLSIPAEGGEFPIKIGSEILGGFDRGYTVSGYGCGQRNETPTGFTLTVAENWGNELPINIAIHGNASGDDGVDIKATQAGSTKVKSFRDGNDGYVDASGTPYINGSTVFTGAIYYDCAVDYGANILSNISVSHSWIHLNTRNSGLVGLGSGYSAAQVDEYAQHGTINGSNPNFRGKVATYYVGVTFDANSGSAREGTLTFPGNKVFTIHQLGV